MQPAHGQEFRVAVHHEGEVRRVLAIPGTGVTVGRVPGQDLVLDDPRVSRSHCRIFLQHGRPWVEDSGSSSGIFVNGEAVARTALKPGDEVQVGPFLLVLETGSADPVPAPVSAQTPVPEPVPAGVVPGPEGRPGGRDLTILLSLLETLDVGAPREDVLRRILDALLDLLDGERAYLYRQRPGRKAVECIFTHIREDADRDMPVSETLVREVARTREPRLMADLPGLDGDAAGSIARLADAHIQSIVIAPLVQGRRLAGVLYVDSRGSRRSFTSRDLDLLARCTRYLAGTVDGIETRDELDRENSRLRAIVRGQGADRVPLDELHEPSSPFARVMEDLRKGAASDVSVLIGGETGSGKEEAARAIHRFSPRRAGPFIAVNCGAIPDSLVESELFGYVRGAFSGAVEDRAGLVELAHGGTLFLDEVGELPLPVQVKLLRVLEEREVRRIGSGEPIPVDFRLLAATHRDLATRVRDGTFRQDLLYRLNVFPIILPPLRERTMDLPRLVEFLIRRLAPRVGKEPRDVDPEVVRVLASYEWPGNIRELRNVLERALVLEETDELGVASLPVEIVRAARPDPAPSPAMPPPVAGADPSGAPGVAAGAATPPRPYGDELRDFERGYFRRLKRAAGTNVSAMSRIAGLTRLTLYRKLGQIGLEDDET